MSGDMIETMAKALETAYFDAPGVREEFYDGDSQTALFASLAAVALSVVRDELADEALRGDVVDALRDTGEDDGPYLPAAAFRALTAVAARFGGAP